MVLLSTAYHEAGHFVTGLAMGLRMRKVTIEPDRDYLGYVECPHRFSDPAVFLDARKEAQIRRRLVMLLAGYAAERFFNPRARRAGASTDHHHVVQLASYLSSHPGELNHWIAISEIRAQRLVEANQKAIKCLAKRLIYELTMNGRRAATIAGFR